MGEVTWVPLDKILVGGIPVWRCPHGRGDVGPLDETPFGRIPVQRCPHGRGGQRFWRGVLAGDPHLELSLQERWVPGQRSPLEGSPFGGVPTGKPERGVSGGRRYL